MYKRPKNFKTNGTVTRTILKAAKFLTGEELRKEVAILLEKFPLSSHKLVYDQDEKKVDPDAWAIIIECCVESDKRKMERKNRWLEEMGGKVSAADKKSYGRYTA